ncbi:DASH family cryptochrome [Fulvivirgaceae bacterium LMO-SS25]
MKKGTAIVWLRNDLRLHDNEVLSSAIQKTEYQIPVYIIDPGSFAQGDLGFSKIGAYRFKFLLEALADLRGSMRKIGADLLVKVGKPEDILPDLAQNLKANVVYTSQEVTQEELSVEKKLENKLFAQKISIEYFWQSTLFHVDDISYPAQHIPDIFTEFRKETEKTTKVRKLIPIPTEIQYPKGLEAGEIPSLASLGFALPPIQVNSAFPFAGGEKTALERVKYYLWESNLITEYKETRNGLIGTDYSSKLSPWLSLGCISPRYIYFEIIRYEKERKKNQSTYWLIFELIWRDYFRFIARKFGNKLFAEGGLKDNKSIRWRNDIAKFIKWREGETGVPFIDANMRELKLTGFMSNRGRQNVASFLTKDLQIGWRWGAAWFEHCLIDYDPCSNWGNWAYVAGVGNDPRENRYFNILTQAKRYDPQGDYVRIWLPEIAQLEGFKINRPDQYKNGLNYPSPLVNMEKWA